MEKFCIIGYPVSHSASPKIYNEYFKRINYDGFYGMEEIAPENFENRIDHIFEHYDGFNVTIPHKERVIPHLKMIEEGARIVGAINCVVSKNRRGYNTDWMGFVRSFPKTDWNGIIVLGAGGTARAVIYGLRKIGVSRITLLNRTYTKALSLKKWADSFGMEITAKPLDTLKQVLKYGKILINTTSVGMRGEKFDLSMKDLENLNLIYDVIYFKTPLQEMGKAMGIKVVDGKEMLYNQAVENLKIWDVPLVESLFREIFNDVMGKMRS
ncbi:MAG: shikimate dehydrogenase [Thermotogae bacterium]|nr:shikimate dehydrogenase [Thermotogota bacterium]